MSIPKIVLTGPPASGKSSFLKWFQERHATALVIPEMATILRSCGYIPEVDDTSDREEAVLISLYKTVEGYLDEVCREVSEYELIVSDRGVPDCFAYCTPALIDKLNIDVEQEINRFDLVLFFMLPPTEEDYIAKQKSNLARPENYQEATSLEEKLMSVWSSHPNLAEIAFADTALEKYQLAEKLIMKQLANAGKGECS